MVVLEMPCSSARSSKRQPRRRHAAPHDRSRTRWRDREPGFRRENGWWVGARPACIGASVNLRSVGRRLSLLAGDIR